MISASINKWITNLIPKNSVEISIIHPSRNRSQMAFETAKQWLSHCADASRVQYVLSLDSDDFMLNNYRGLFAGFGKQVSIVAGNNSNAIQAINSAAKHTSGRILVVVSDDFDCPRHWDEQLIASLKGKNDFVVKTHDGLQPFIITLPIMDRTFYDRFGYIYNPAYQHMYSDTELSCVGHMLGRTINLDILFPHRHYTTGAKQRDALNIKNDRTFPEGARVFNERKKINFGIDNPVHPYPASFR